jgi:CRP/FNR family transcriptional regulator
MSASLPVLESTPDSCFKCGVRANAIFCNLTDGVLKKLDQVKIPAQYPKGAILCNEGYQSRGAFIICKGRVKLSTMSSEGRSLIVRIAKAGEIIGVSAALAGSPYEVTAETMEHTTVSFVTRQDFLNLLQHCPDLGLRLINQLAYNYRSSYQELRSLGLSGSVAEKLARLLLEWAGSEGAAGNKSSANGRLRFTMRVTQEEIAELIGSTRETVSRQLSDFRHRKIVEIHGPTVTLLNRAELERMVS